MMIKKTETISKARIKELVDKFSTISDVMVIGDIGIDKYTYGEVRRISPEAPVPVVEVKKEWHKLGLAANISDNFKALSVGSFLCGIIGEDDHAGVLENLLEEKDLSIWGLVRDKTRPTIYKERVTTNSQQICRIDYEQTHELSCETEKKFKLRINEFMNSYDAIILEDYAKGTLTEEVCQSVISEAKKRNVLVAVDPGVSCPAHFYKGATLLKPNRKEAELICRGLGFKSDNIEEMAKFLLSELDLSMIVITLGGDGMAMLEKGGEVKIIPTVANEVFDVSGAGDTAHALLTASLKAGATLEEAAWIANCGSGVVVAKKGTATVSREELLAFHQQFLAPSL